MRFLAVVSLSLFVGLTLGSPVGQKANEEVTTSLPQVRDDVDGGTTVVVEILADEAATSVAVTERARQGGPDESEEGDNEEATTASSVSNRNRPEPAIPQPLTNASDFLQEFQFSSQFNLGPKEGVPVEGGVQPLAQSVEGGVGGVGAPAPANPQAPAEQVPALPPAAAVTTPDESEEADSDEVTPTEAPTARQQQEQQQGQRVEESDSDNEITNDDPATTVKSFISEYEYTVQQLGNRGSERDDVDVKPPIALESASLINTNSSDLDDLDIEGMSILSDGNGRAACECGKLPFRVPIGSEAELNLRPWTVAIVRGGLIAGGRPHCAGVLINDRYVLTSASCVTRLAVSGTQIWLTAHNSLDDNHRSVGTSKINIQTVIEHPNYNPTTKANDIALIKMVHPVDINTNPYFTPVCLPSDSSYDYVGRAGTIFGWGHGRTNSICEDRVPILDTRVCKRDSQYGERLTDNMMCAGYLTPTSNEIRTDTCIGDSGGPLTVQINSRTALIGVTSWGYEFHQRGYNPTVYTKVSGYADWILHNTPDADWCSV